jgi:hypothetical protein
MEKGRVVLRLLFPPDEDRPEAIHPAMGALNHPSSGFALDRLRLLTSGTDVRGATELLQDPGDLAEVIGWRLRAAG